jgi:hypothetical protein
MSVDRPCNIVWSWFVVMLVVTFAVAPQAHAQCEQQSLQADEPAPNDGFGAYSVISGDHAAVGLFEDDTNGNDSGAVLMYQRDPMTNRWVQSQKIIPPDNQPGDAFGTRPALEGDTLIVGARGDDDLGLEAGSAYIYRRNSATSEWTMETKLLASDGQAQDGFGYTTALSGERVIVGASRIPIGAGASAAYIFHRSPSGSWKEQAILGLSPNAPEDHFGYAVGMDDDVALVSARTIAGSKPWLERVHAYRFDSLRSQWHLEQLIESPEASEWEAHFGITLAVDEDTAVIGSPLFGSLGQRAYVFRYERTQSHWTHEITLPASGSPVEGAWLSQWVDVRGNRVALGDVYDTSLPQQNGAVFLYERDPASARWFAIGVVRASDGAQTGNDFGLAVALDDGQLVVGAPAVPIGTPGESSGPGSAYFIDLAGIDCNGTIVCDDVDIANGTSNDRNANGTPDECEFVPGDATGDGQVNIDDLIAVILAWGACPHPPDICTANVAPPPDGDDVVDVDDLVLVILNWSA